MTKRISLLLGSCLLLQIGTLLRDDAQANVLGSTNLESSETAEPASESIPLFHREQSRELLGDSASWSEDQDAIADRSIELTHFVRNRVRDLLPFTWRPKTSRIAKTLVETGNRYHMDPLFLMALIKHESKFNPAAIGSHGEIGLMQIKPATARWLLGTSVKLNNAQIKRLLRDPQANIALGTAYLAKLRATFNGRSDLYISAYNMGTHSVNRLLKDGLRPKVYVDKVLGEYAALSERLTDTDMAEQLVTEARQVASLDLRTLALR